MLVFEFCEVSFRSFDRLAESLELLTFLDSFVILEVARRIRFFETKVEIFRQIRWIVENDDRRKQLGDLWSVIVSISMTARESERERDD